MYMFTSINEEPVRVTSELPSAITAPPVVTPPVAKPWVMGLEDNNARNLSGPGGTFNPPITGLATPVKGSVVLALTDNLDPTILYAGCYVYDGTKWNDCSGGATLSTRDKGSGDSPTVRAFFSGPNALTDYLAANFMEEELIVCADNTGLHLIISNDDMQMQTTDVPYPAGITLADMPPSKTFE